MAQSRTHSDNVKSTGIQQRLAVLGLGCDARPAENVLLVIFSPHRDEESSRVKGVYRGQGHITS